MYNFDIVGSGLLTVPDPTSKPEAQSSSNVGAIAGGIAGVVVLLLIVIIVVVMMRRRSSGPEKSYLTNDTTVPMGMTIENEAFSRSPEEEYAYLSENSVSNGLDKSN